ncbi:MAG TPA: phosphotransferase [Gaiellaceae bacterium]|nr:phosphotransferase [Gaiellaceae bacterium]
MSVVAESTIAETLFERGNLSRVLGVMLEDGREVVIKLRPWQDRLRGCIAVQRHLVRAGYPCPAPVAGLDHVGGWAVHAEVLVHGEEQREPDRGAAAYAALLRRLVAAAPEVSRVPALLPSPPWTAWDHAAAATWPARDDRGVNLNLFDGPAWVDDAAQRVRRALVAYGAPLRVGHGDWESQNIRWNGNDPLVVHDWDSAIAQPEAAVVGLAAAVWAAQGGPGEAATVAQTEEFVGSYERASGGWSEHDRAAAWSAGLWVRLFNAKKDATEGGGPQLERLGDEIGERLHRAGLDP